MGARSRAIVGLVLLVVAALPALAPSSSASGPAPATLTIGPYVASEQYGFWSVRMGGANMLNHTLANLYNQTPYVYIRYASGDQATNVTNQSRFPTGCFYSDAGVCNRPLMDFSSFAIFCAWVHCRSIVDVPAETNDAGLVATTVRWIEQTDGFTPSLWALGNEPDGYDHWNEPFAKWKVTDHAAPTATQWGKETVNLTRAIRSVDTTTKILGTEDSGGIGSPARITQVAAYSWQNVSSVAFHSYPGGTTIAGSTAQFLSWRNVTRTSYFYAQNLAAYGTGCGGCQVPSLLVNEYNGALANVSSSYLAAYPDAVLYAATAAELLAQGCSMLTWFDWYDSNSLQMINSSNGAPTPVFYVVSNLLRDLPVGDVFNATVSSTVGGVFAVEGVTGLSHGILIVNTNVSSGVNVSLGSAINLPAGGDVVIYSSSPAQQNPSSFGTTAPSWVIVPAEGIELVDWTQSVPQPQGNVSSGNPVGTGPWSPVAAQVASAFSNTWFLVGIAVLLVLVVGGYELGRPRAGRV